MNQRSFEITPEGPDEPVSAAVVELMSVLSNEIRIEVLTSLAKAEKCVTDIADELKLDESTVSHALKRLRNVDLVEHQVVLKNHIYRLTKMVETKIDGDALLIHIRTASLNISIKTKVE